jgi:hypothetical protein
MKNAYFLTLFLISACVAVAEETPHSVNTEPHPSDGISIA